MPRSTDPGGSRDPARYLQVDQAGAGLRHQSVVGAKASVVSQGLKLIIRFGSMVVLSRLLMPSDFGLIAMVAAIIGFADLFRDFGLSSATIQRTSITHQQVSNLFWINAAIGLAAAIVVGIGAPAIAWFYDEPRLTLITVLLAANVFLGALPIQHQAVLRRQMRFGALALAEVISMIAGVVVGVLMAVSGAGYWSLVGMGIATSLATFVIVWSVCGWRPARPRRRAGTRSLVEFGRDLYVASIANHFARNLDNILIGWRWGSEPLGLYNRAYQLFMLPLSQVSAPFGNVLLPVLSRLTDDGERYRRYFRKSLTAIGALTIPFAAICAVQSDEVVMLLFGANWLGVAPILTALSIAGLMQPAMSSVGWIYVSTGRTRQMLVWSLVGSAVFVTSFVVGLPYGALGVASAYAVARLLLAVPAFYAASRGGPVLMRDFFLATAAPLLGGAVAAVVVSWLIWSLRPIMHEQLAFVVACVGAYLCALASQFLVDRDGVMRDMWQEGMRRWTS